MKSATAILVALTVFTLFLESSTAPAESNAMPNVFDAITEIDATVNIKDEDKQEMYERMDSSEAALPRAKEIAADAITKATGTQKLTFVAVYDYLAVLEPAVLSIHKEIKATIASGLVIKIKAVSLQIDAAIATSKGTMDGFNIALPPGESKDGINGNVDKVMTNAAKCSEILKTYIAYLLTVNN